MVCGSSHLDFCHNNMAESRRTRRPRVGHAEPHCGGGGWHPRPAGERALPLHSESVGASRVESRETAGVEYPEGLALCFLTNGCSLPGLGHQLWMAAGIWLQPWWTVPGILSLQAACDARFSTASGPSLCQQLESWFELMLSVESSSLCFPFIFSQHMRGSRAV